jgi:hypothetical protein
VIKVSLLALVTFTAMSSHIQFQNNENKLIADGRSQLLL